MNEAGKARLLEAACAVIATKGIEGLRTKDVAAAADASTALLHYHYGSKRELLLAAFEYSDDRAFDAASRALEGAGTGQERLKGLLLAWAGDDVEMQRHWIIWGEMWRWSMFDTALRRTVAERHGRFITSIGDLIRLGKADGSVVASVETAEAAQRLAACSDSFGDQAVLGILSMGEMRAALLRAVEHECLAVEVVQ